MGENKTQGIRIAKTPDSPEIAITLHREWRSRGEGEKGDAMMMDRDKNKITRRVALTMDK